MKAIKLLLVLASTMCISAYAGPNDGGGGQGLVCPGPDGKLKVTLLDLWEAQNIHPHDRQFANLVKAADESPEALRQLVADGIQRLKGIFANPITVGGGKLGNLKGSEATADMLNSTAIWFLEHYANLIEMRKANISLSNDAYEFALPENCELKQIVNWRGNQQVFVNMDLYDQMDNVNKAALILHESLYALLREFGETNSIRVRRAVGFVMSGNSFVAIEEKISGRQNLICTDDSISDVYKRSIVYLVNYNKEDGVNGTFPMIAFIKGVPILGPDRSQGFGESIDQILSATKRKANGGYVNVGGDLGVSVTDFDTAAMVTYYSNTLKLNVKLTKLAGQSRIEEANLTCRPSK